MLNKERHRLLMGRILRDIYSDISISSLLGFKGGTCAYFFYNLPRFSVGLDFDLLELNEAKKNIVFKQLETIISQYGEIKDKYIKKNTILFLLSYEKSKYNIKLEISTRTLKNIKDYYEIRNYLGTAMLIAQKKYLFSAKLAALTLRKKTASRDIYDTYYFAKNNWDIDTAFIKEITGQDINKYLDDCITLVEKIDNKQIMQGLGELVSEKEKKWVKEKLKPEVIFMLRNYKQALG